MMSNDYLDTFISPQTGRRYLEKGSAYVGGDKNMETPLQSPVFTGDLGDGNIWIGSEDNAPEESVFLKDFYSRFELLREEVLTLERKGTFIVQTANKLLLKAQALNQLNDGFLYNTKGILSVEIPGAGDLSLQEGYVYVGDSSNVAAETPTIQFSNLPDLTSKKIWRGNTNNRPEESDSLTTAESSLSGAIQDLANLANVVNTIANTVDALATSVNAIETGLASIGGFAAIILLQSQVLSLFASVAILASRVSDLGESVSAIKGQIGDIYNKLAAINQRLDGLRLNNIPADGDVSFYDFKLINLKSDDVKETDGLNAKFLWDLMHDNVGVVWI
jgi:hypothetical protein